MGKSHIQNKDNFVVTAVERRNIMSKVYSTVMEILYESPMYGCSLWPKNGFIPGSFPALNRYGNYKLDFITVNVIVNRAFGYQKIRFNLWNKTYARGVKQHNLLDLIFDHTEKNGIYFKLEYPEITTLMGHEYEYCVMGTFDLKFEIQ
ncbi:hypothetical protein ACJVDH_00140 [Pedobacter sp. AW1-32]|uniref:hypothetical protein n=1 Tax=Pedobacter sp. AW1-32 TaxID=3383026 RepID=UPI003FEFB4A6